MKCKADEKAGHRERLRERFLRSGLTAFHDYEVIELLLTLSTPRKDCKPAAKEALARFGTLQAVFEASLSQLCEVKGIGPKNAYVLKLIKEVADRYLEKKVIGADPVRDSKSLFNFLYHRLRDLAKESFTACYLDAKNRITSVDLLSEGSLTYAGVYPREVLKSAIEKKAASLIFVHNHPSGDPEPSNEDIRITRKLFFACRSADINILDHIIIGENRYFSMADSGWMARFESEYKKIGNP